MATPAFGAGMPKDEGGATKALKAIRLGGSIAAAADDEIPGVAIPASPFSDTLDALTDDEDVYAINLVAGQTLQVSMTGAAATDFDVYLYEPGSVSVNSDEPCASSDGETYPEAFSYNVTTTGTYYLEMYGYSGAGAYTVTYAVTTTVPDNDVPGVAIPASPISGTLDADTDYDDVFAVKLTAGQTIQVSMTGAANTDFDVFLYGPGCTTVDSVDDYLTGSELLTYPERFTYVASAAGTYYLDAFASEGSGAYTLSYTIKSNPIIGNPIAPTYMSRLRYYNVYGTLKPRHTAGTYPVRIYKYRYVSGAWKSYGYVLAKAYDYGTNTTKYLRSVRLPYAGRWRLRAYAPADTGHVALWSTGYDYVTVR